MELHHTGKLLHPPLTCLVKTTKANFKRLRRASKRALFSLHFAGLQNETYFAGHIYEEASGLGL